MNALIITLLITNAVVNLGVATVVGSEVRKLNKQTEALRDIALKNNIDIRKAKSSLLKEIAETNNKISVSNADNKDSMRDIVKEEIPKGIMRYLYDPFAGVFRK
jgi:uncharacterized membrane protein YfhO